MALKYSSYYGLTRITDSGPEIKNWAVTDANIQTTSIILKTLEQHVHTGATPMNFPGYNLANPVQFATPILTLSPTGGYIQAGVTIGVRFSFTNNLGLETEGSPETFVQTPPIVIRPNAVVVSNPVSTPVPGAVQGGTYIYAITKRQGTGESELSDVTTVDVPFTTTGLSSYTVPIAFDPIASYADGTDSLCLYRSTGFDNSFVLLNTFTATPDLQNNTTTYTDGGVIQDFTQQPPQGSEFGKQNVLNINWSNLSIPSDAYFINIYLTQQAGVWGTQNLFQQYDLKNIATPAPTQINYQGTEILSTGYPQEFSQIPGGPSLVYLTTQANGGFRLTEPADARGWPTWNFVFPDQNHATPVFANAYVDRSTGQFKIALSTPGGVGVYTTLASVGSGYVHSTVEPGGHTASHIQMAPNVGGPTLDQVVSAFSTPVPGGPSNFRKQATSIYRPTATPSDIVNSVVGVERLFPDLDTAILNPTGISPDFPGQWVEVNFQSWCFAFAGTGSGAIISSYLKINNVIIPESYSGVGQAPMQAGTGIYGTLNFSYATPLTRSNNRFQVAWFLSFPGYALSYGGNVVGIKPRRSMLVKELF